MRGGENGGRVEDMREKSSDEGREKGKGHGRGAQYIFREDDTHTHTLFPSVLINPEVFQTSVISCPKEAVGVMP